MGRNLIFGIKLDDEQKYTWTFWSNNAQSYSLKNYKIYYTAKKNKVHFDPKESVDLNLILLNPKYSGTISVKNLSSSSIFILVRGILKILKKNLFILFNEMFYLIIIIKLIINRHYITTLIDMFFFRFWMVQQMYWSSKMMSIIFIIVYVYIFLDGIQKKFLK